MRDALLIVVIAGVSPGLRWELEAIAQAGHQSKLVVLMPEPHRRRRWEVITQELRDVPGFDGLPREVPKGLLCVHAGPGVGCTLLSALRSGKIDYDTAIQLAIYGMLRAAPADSEGQSAHASSSCGEVTPACAPSGRRPMSAP